MGIGAGERQILRKEDAERKEAPPSTAEGWASKSSRGLRPGHRPFIRRFLVFLVFSQRSPLRFFLDLQTIRTIPEFLSGLKFHDFVLYVVEVKASNAPILSCLDDHLAW